MMNYIIDEKYSVLTSGTSDGTQDKFYRDGIWYKLDRYGGEGLAEYTASVILRALGCPDEQYVEYKVCQINNKSGCYSTSFLNENDSFVTLYRLYQNAYSRDLAQVCSQMDYDDAIEYVIGFVKDITTLDIREYLANHFLIDYLILNEDRHFNNLGVVFDGEKFRIAPIFDNGKSFFNGNVKAETYENLRDKIKCAYAKAFSPSFEMNYKYLKKHCTLNINRNLLDVMRADSLIPNSHVDIVGYQMKRMT